MRNRIYLEGLNIEENHKLDLIRKFIGIDSYARLSLIFMKIEKGISLSARERLHLAIYYGYEAETMSADEVREYINLYYQLYKDTLKFAMIEFDDAFEDLWYIIKYEWSEFKERVKRKWEKMIRKFLG